jgi:hypothetical protein
VWGGAHDPQGEFLQRLTRFHFQTIDVQNAPTIGSLSGQPSPACDWRRHGRRSLVTVTSNPTETVNVLNLFFNATTNHQSQSVTLPRTALRYAPFNHDSHHHHHRGIVGGAGVGHI